MSLENIFYSIKDKKKVKSKPETQLLNSLYETPKREKGVDVPHLQIFEAGYLQQADLLYMPTDDLDADKNEKQGFYATVKRDKIRGGDKLFFDYIHKSFKDKEDKKTYIIIDVVKPTNKNKHAKSGLFFKYYENIYKSPPTDESLFEYTKCDILVNAKWTEFKKGTVKVVETKVENNKYSYILVVVDAHNKKVDAEPLKNRSATDIIDAFKQIYIRKNLEIPEVMACDPGTEFNNEQVKTYFKNLQTRLKFGLPNRHRQQSLVERQNKFIGTVLLKNQANKELASKKVNKEWVKDLPLLIKLINETVPKNPTNDAISDTPLSTKFSEDLIPLHTHVRTKLDYPIDPATHKRIGAVIRNADIKWSPKTQEVDNIILKPGYPPMYQLSGKETVAYTKQQLQPIFV